MTSERIEVDFNLKPKERVRAIEFLIQQEVKKDWGFLSYVQGTRSLWILVPLSAFVLVPNFLELTDQIWRGVRPMSFGIVDTIGILIGFSILGQTIKYTWDWLRNLFGKAKMDWIGREGVHWGPARMTATDDVLIIERAKYRSTLRWPAIPKVQENRRALLLMLTNSSAIVVPKSAFATKDSEQSFRDFVEQRV